jgi:hypothetical protein
MKKSACLIIAVVGCAMMGCSAMNDSRDMGHTMVNSMFPTPDDRADSHQDENRVDREHENMMLDARHGLAASKEPDGWWSNWLMSPKSRSIERSLGVEYQ